MTPAPRRGKSEPPSTSAAPAAADPPRAARGPQRVAWLLDDVIRIPGTNLRFGIDPLLGLLPGGGDLAGGVLSGYIILAAARAGAPSSVLVRMGLNVVVDAVVGTVPLLGDLFDAGYKANRRNAALLQRYVAAPAPVQRSNRAVLVLVLTALALVLIGAAALGILLLRWLIGQF
ncbi:MAG TPA: DUF4112 domain-containing protein [Longimicrobiales bacterium]|nr:DUF4112 domain-containing protein [Longimicrobiales bacterium]